MVVHAIDELPTDVLANLDAFMEEAFANGTPLTKLPSNIATYRVRIPKMLAIGPSDVEDMTALRIPFFPLRPPPREKVEARRRRMIFNRWYGATYRRLALAELKAHVATLQKTASQSSIWNAAALVMASYYAPRGGAFFAEVRSALRPLWKRRPTIAESIIDCLPWLHEGNLPHDALNQLKPDSDDVALLQAFVSSLRPEHVPRRIDPRAYLTGLPRQGDYAKIARRV